MPRHRESSIHRSIAQSRVYQTQKTHAFTVADKLLGDLETHPATKRVACNEIRSVRLNSPDFGDVIGSYRFDRAGNAVLSIQRRRLQSKYRTVALEMLSR